MKDGTRVRKTIAYYEAIAFETATKSLPPYLEVPPIVQLTNDEDRPGLNTKLSLLHKHWQALTLSDHQKRYSKIPTGVE